MAVTYSLQEAHERFAEVIDKAAKEYHRVYIKDGERVIAEIIPGQKKEGDSHERNEARLVGRGEVIPAQRDHREAITEWQRRFETGELKTSNTRWTEWFIENRGRF